MTNSFANEKVTCEISTPLRLKINMCNINTFANEINSGQIGTKYQN